MALSAGPPPTRRAVVVAVAVGAGTLLYGVACLVSRSYGFAFFGIPVVVGAAAGVLSPSRPYRAALLAVFLGLLLSIVTFREGIICVLMSLPLVIPLALLGASAGSVLRRHVRTRRAQAGTIGVLLLLAMSGQMLDRMCDNPARHPIHVVDSEIDIAAPPDSVFSILTAHEFAVENRWPWLLRIGLPTPERMIVEKPGVGGRMRFEYPHMSVFATITRWSPGKELAYTVDRYDVRDLPFHITRLGRSPSYGLREERVQDWLTVLSTSYTFRPSTKGTTLRRHMVWQRHLFPSLYFSWLQQSIIERGQRRLLELIAERTTTLFSDSKERHNTRSHLDPFTINAVE
jgi:uncharacterized protein YndB with AHSA1/START domain